jgi:transposase
MQVETILSKINIDKIPLSTEVRNIFITLMNLVEWLYSELKKVRLENEELKARVRELTGQSAKPDIKPQVVSRSGRDKSSQFNTKRSRGKSKERIIPIDEEKTYPAPDTYCPYCEGQKLHSHSEDVVVTQELIIKRRNIKHRFPAKICPCCGYISRAELPEEYGNTHFGPNLRSFISIEHYDCRVSIEKIHRFLTQFGIVISRTEINRLLLDNGRAISPIARVIHKRGISNSEYTQMDDTGWRTKGRNKYMYHHGSDRFSYFEITPKRNSKTAERILTEEGRNKPFLTDDHSSFHPIQARDKALCWIHEIRHYEKMRPAFESNKEKVDRVISELWDIYDILNEYKDNPSSTLKKQISFRFDKVVSTKTGYDVLDHQLSLTAKKKDRLLKALEYPFVPLHNNGSELSIRQGVTYRKVSGGCRSPSGEKSLSSHLSLFDTCRKLGLNIWDITNRILKGTITSNSFALFIPDSN